MESWLQRYNHRERLLIESCRTYAANATRIVLPGHNLMLMVAALSAQLDEAYGQLKGGAREVPCRGSGGVPHDSSISKRLPEDGPGDEARLPAPDYKQL